MPATECAIRVDIYVCDVQFCGKGTSSAIISTKTCTKLNFAQLS